MRSRGAPKEPESVYRSLPAIKRRPGLAPAKKGKLVPPTGSTLGLFNQSSFIRNVAGNERLKDPKIHKQTYTMGIPTERSVRRPPSEFMRKGRGLQLLERKMRKTRADRAYSAKFDEAMKFIGERRRDLPGVAEEAEAGEEEGPDRGASQRSRLRPENIFNAVPEGDEESRYGDALAPAQPQPRAQSSSRSGPSRRERHSAEPRPAAGADAAAAQQARAGPARLPPIRGRQAASGKSQRATSSKSRRRRTPETNGFEKWFKKHRQAHVNELDPDEVQAISAALRSKLAALNQEFQARSHKRFMTPGQARRQQELEAQMQRLEAHLAKLCRDSVFYLK